MATFKVVLSGIDLSAEQTHRISRAVQQSVLNELADIDPGAGIMRAESSFAWLPIFNGEMMGLVGTQPADPEVLQDLAASEFGG